MNYRIWRLSLFMIILMANTLFAKEITKSSLDQLMSLSGLNKQINEYPNIFIEGMNEAKKVGGIINNDEFDAIQLAAKNSFNSTSMLNIIGTKIKKDISESEAKELLMWYKSDIGKTITKAEEDATTPTAYQDMISQAKVLFADQKRLNYAFKMENLLNATDMAMKIQNKTSFTIYSAMTKSANPYKAIQMAEFKKQMAAQEGQIRENMKQFIILSFIYSYKDLDFAIIDKYIDFLEKDKTKKFNKSVTEGIEISFNKSIDKLAKLLPGIKKKFSN